MTALEYARELVAFDSVSSRSNVAVTDQIEARLRRLGFEIERLEYDDARGVRKATVIGRKVSPPTERSPRHQLGVRLARSAAKPPIALQNDLLCFWEWQRPL